MRIISGSAKGHTLKIPKAKDLRPALEKVRASVFSIIGEKVEDTSVLDLFAGTGSYGIEALSRGALHCDFVDISRECARVIGENLKHTKFLGRGKVFQRDVARFAKECGKRYNLIFVAPPYALEVSPQLLKQIGELLQPEGLIIFEHAKGTKVPEVEGLNVADQRNYGQTRVSFMIKQ